MAKITLDTITSSFASTSLFNTNFTAIKDELNDKVLYRDNPTGEANQMLNDLDMNSNDILNASSVNADVIVLNGTQITPTGTTSLPASGLTYDNSTSGLTATNVQAAIDEVEARVDTAETDITSIETQQAQGQNYGKNLIIDGAFDIWPEGTSGFTSQTYTSVMCSQIVTGTTISSSRQNFTVGDTASNSKYYHRSAVTSVAGAGNRAAISFIIEGVQPTAGKTVTLSFTAKADAAKNIAVEFAQNFGTGGSPSSAVTGISVTTVSLTTSFVRYEVTANIPSASGKTLGTNGNDFLTIILWMDAGSSFDARTNSLGQQSGTFDFADVQLEFGDTATDFEIVNPADNLARSKRYFEDLTLTSVVGSRLAVGYQNTTTTATVLSMFEQKRGVPALSFSDVSDFSIGTATGQPVLTSLSFTTATPNSFNGTLAWSGAIGAVGDSCMLRINTSDARLFIDARL